MANEASLQGRAYQGESTQASSPFTVRLSLSSAALRRAKAEALIKRLLDDVSREQALWLTKEIVILNIARILSL